jgi:hypothetical protein
MADLSESASDVFLLLERLGGLAGSGSIGTFATCFGGILRYGESCVLVGDGRVFGM